MRLAKHDPQSDKFCAAVACCATVDVGQLPPVLTGSRTVDVPPQTDVLADGLSRGFRANSGRSVQPETERGWLFGNGTILHLHELSDLRLGAPLAEAFGIGTELALAIEQFVSN
jgi:hypothetical protein